MTIKRKTTHEFQSVGSDLTVAEVVKFLSALPDIEAKVRFKTESPDRPGEQTVITITVIEEYQ